jgi:F-type H+-transporting ATPase subunit c
MHSKSLLLVVLAFTFLVGTCAFAAEPAKAPAGPDNIAVKLEATKAISWMLLAAVLGMAFAAAGAAVSQAITASAALQGIARQPEASGKLFMPMILTVVFIETLAIYTLVLGLLFIFVNPLKGMLG